MRTRPPRKTLSSSPTPFWPPSSASQRSLRSQSSWTTPAYALLPASCWRQIPTSAQPSSFRAPPTASICSLRTFPRCLSLQSALRRPRLWSTSSAPASGHSASTAMSPRRWAARTRRFSSQVIFSGVRISYLSYSLSHIHTHTHTHIHSHTLTHTCSHSACPFHPPCPCRRNSVRDVVHHAGAAAGSQV